MPYNNGTRVVFNSYEFIPAPFITLRKEYNFSEDGELLSPSYTATLSGKLFVEGVGDENLAEMLLLQKNLRRGCKVESPGNLAIHVPEVIEGLPSIVQMGATPKSIEFAPGNWVKTCDYTVVFDCDFVDDDDSGLPEDALSAELQKYRNITKLTNDWNFEAIDERLGTYRLSHTVSATAKKLLVSGVDLNNKTPWENARAYIEYKNLLGFNAARITDPNNYFLKLSSLNNYNHQRTHVINEKGGTYTVSESWICCEENYTNEYTVGVRKSLDGNDTVSIEGTIVGLAGTGTNTSGSENGKYTAAQAHWNTFRTGVFAKVSDVSGITLNEQNLTEVVSHNEISGTISYNFEFDNRPNPLVEGSLSETIVINESRAADVFAVIPVIFRSLGPVLQDIETKTLKKKAIIIEVQLRRKSLSYTPTKPDLDAKFDELKPTSTNSLVPVFRDSDEESWSEYTGKYTRSVSFVYQ